MRSYRALRLAVVGACVAGVGALVWAIDAQEASAPAGASQEDMMARYMALAEPGPEHHALAAMEGDFVADGVSYCAPAPEPVTFTGTQSSRMILGGRFLQSDYEGEMMGIPYEGLALIGYDNVKKQFNSLWADSMTTFWMTSQGSADSSLRVFSFTGSYDDPVTGQTTTMRQVTTVIDDDHYTLEMFGPNPDPAGDGAEMKLIQINYTRQ